MKKKENPIGIRLGNSTRRLVEMKAQDLNKSICEYMRDVIQKSLGLPAGLNEGNKTAELILRVQQLERENQRLKYEGGFNTEAFEYENVEVVSPSTLIAPKIVEQVL